MAITPKARKPLSSLTSYEKEKELSRLSKETEYVVSQLGQDSEKAAVPLVQEYVEEQQKEDRIQREVDLERLKDASSNRVNYQRYLVVILHRFVQEESIPKTYSLYVDSNDEGIVLGIAGTEYLGAFKVCGIPFYDIAACKTLAVQLGNTIARMEGHFKETDSGIIIADKNDLDIALKHGRTN